MSIGEFGGNSSATGTLTHVFVERIERARNAMRQAQVDALLLSVGPDLPWLTGFAAMALERLTMLVLTSEGPARLVVPAFEADRVHDPEGLFELIPWEETDDPAALVTTALGGATRGRLAIGDHTWSRFLVALQSELRRCLVDHGRNGPGTSSGDEGSGRDRCPRATLAPRSIRSHLHCSPAKYR